jgi:hypothetical protein
MEGAMSCGEIFRGPFGLDTARGQTMRPERTVLAVAHHLTAATRLADVMPLLEADRRVQVVYTVSPSSMFFRGADDFLAGLGGVVIPWSQASQTSFDLAVAAAPGLLEQLHAPVLKISHGAGNSKFPARWPGSGPQARRETTGREQASLVYRGRVIPARIIVATRRDANRLRLACPLAAPLAVVGGDPAYDRLAASLPSRVRYRAGLGTQDRTLVAITSTWGPGSLLQRCPDLPARLAAELPRDEFRVALFMHPHVWTWHGRRQIEGWFADGVADGLVLVPPEEGWRAVLAAADVVVGDHGSAGAYAAAAGLPVLLAAFPDDEVDPDSPAACLHRRAGLLRIDRPLEPQVRAAAGRRDPGIATAVRSRITDVPGSSARIIRRVMYELMSLPEPKAPAVTRPVPVLSPEPAGAVR